MTTLWAIVAFLGGLLIPDPWTLIRIYRYRRLDWDALIGTRSFSRDVLVYVKRRTERPGKLVFRNGRFHVVPLKGSRHGRNGHS